MNLHHKDTATNNLLHFSSFHPFHLKKGLPTGQFLQVRRNCIDFHDFRKNAWDLSTRLHERIISKAFQRAKTSNREDLPSPKKQEMEKLVRFITQYNDQCGDLRSILTRHWILQMDKRLSPVLPEKPLLTARRVPNLKDKLLQGHFIKKGTRLGRGSRLKGSFPCGGCTICPHMIPLSSFQNPSTGEQIILSNYVNCKTLMVIYGLKCSCPKLYIGQTKLLKRVQKHISTITLANRDKRAGKKLTWIAEHFLQVHNGKTSDLTVFGLDKLCTTIRG